jgi:hypothetical protein
MTCSVSVLLGDAGAQTHVGGCKYDGAGVVDVDELC